MTSCKDDEVDCEAKAEEVSDLLGEMIAASLVYAFDDSSENCKAYKEVLEKYKDVIDGAQDCYDSSDEYQEEIDELNDELEALDC
ncbi:hypothetical protein N7E81_05160 [Reichenbachiella carrageenanivorans]|uniref:Uncharacterized protein n=1 Tax=Reichenbachiella carrageenanivorans TaxID=2979869 RepID=A0ABY6D2V7_9BACT|nr:hypothetical protein [Reichenbachiella carrageenanivorans]UXX80486.1 hypothetical protein N7E81_05160 [Reichenbachiella carrageenanivorans]